MEIDLEKGISFRIEGELGKNHTLPIDTLIDIAKTLQELVISIAKYDLPTDESVDLNNFKLDLADFEKGSVIPTFVLPSIMQTTTFDYSKQRLEVNKSFSTLMSISNTGDYNKLKELYPEYSKRNPIVENLYNFRSSFKNAPVSIYEKGNLSEQYKLKKFYSSMKKKLIVDIKETKEEKKEQDAFAMVNIITTGKRKTTKIKEVFLPERHSLSYSPEIITLKHKQYILNYPLRCLFEKEDDFFLINNELLDLVGTGLTQDEAELSFNEEFDFLYERLNSLGNDKISSRLLNIKNMINFIVKEIV